MKPSTRCALALAAALWLVFVVPSAFAQAVNAPTAFDQFMQRATGAGKQTVQFARDGTPLAAPGVPTITPDGGLPRVDAGGSIRNPSGNRVPVTASGRIPGAQVAKALGRAAGKILPGVGWALAISELASELGYVLSQSPDGTPTYEKQNPVVCSVAPCVEVKYVLPGDGGLSPFSYDKQTACAASAALNVASTYYAYALNPRIVGTSCVVDLYRRTNNNFELTQTYPVNTTRTVPPAPQSLLPSTNQEFLDAVAAKSGWPSSSAVGRALVDPQTQGDEKIQPGPLTISGPSTSPGTTSTTVKPGGNTETTTVTHNHTYAGNTVTTTTVTVVSNYNPVTNITETQTTTETPPNTEPEPEAPPTDTALPALPALYEPKYPNGLAGVWQEKKAALVATPLVSVVSQLMPSVGSGGSCPAWPINLDLGSWDFGTHDVAPPCYIWDWCKFFIIAGALLLARALIFGG